MQGDLNRQTSRVKSSLRSWNDYSPLLWSLIMVFTNSRKDQVLLARCMETWPMLVRVKKSSHYSQAKKTDKDLRLLWYRVWFFFRENDQFREKGRTSLDIEETDYYYHFYVWQTDFLRESLMTDWQSGEDIMHTTWQTLEFGLNCYTFLDNLWFVSSKSCKFLLNTHQ